MSFTYKTVEKDLSLLNPQYGVTETKLAELLIAGVEITHLEVQKHPGRMGRKPVRG
jgi:hypothetical protein